MIEFVRVLLAFSLVYVVIPFLVWRRKGDSTEGHIDLLLQAFLYTSLFLQVTILGLGWLRLALPLLVIVTYAVWILAMLWSDDFPFLRSTAYRQRLVERLFSSLEVQGQVAPALPHLPAWRRPRLSVAGVCLVLMLGVTTADRSLFAIRNLHFPNADDYSRAMGLHALNAGQPWQSDGSVAVLSPLILSSGLSAELVVRFSSPIFALLLIAAVGLCVFRITRQLWAAFIACGLTATMPMLLVGAIALRSARSDMSAVYTILALAVLGRSPAAAAAGAVVAMVSAPASFEFLALPITCVVVACLLGKLAVWTPAWFPRFGGAICSVVFSAALLASWEGHMPDGPLQYESSARACRNISQRFDRNKWLVVSTTFERPFIYRRGWHLEMIDFVANHSVDQVADPAFKFPYAVRDLFLFVEKQPVLPRPWPWRISVTQTMDPCILAYVWPLGRAALQFKAAALVGAYQQSHADLSIFFSDEHLIVYHVRLRA